MDLTIRPMTPQERLYAYQQSPQMGAQTSDLGCYRLSFAENGHGHSPTWEGTYRSQDNKSFKVTTDNLIGALLYSRILGNPIENVKNMTDFCEKYPEAGFDYGEQFAFRVDEGRYAYMLRMAPHDKECNFYCYCYERRSLDRHMKNAERGIRFVDSGYKELFRIPDGDSIRIVHEDGTYIDKVCRYIDEYHVEMGGSQGRLFHICEFAELMERNGSTVIPLRSSLPEQCYGVMPSTGAVIIVKKGVTGYYFPTYISTGSEEQNKALAREYNEKAGVTPAQAEAMLAGSMFGWGCLAADPKNYDEEGKPVPPKHRDRGDAR